MAVQEKPARTVIIKTKTNSETESPDMLLSAMMDLITPPKVRQSTVLYILNANKCLKNDR